MRIRDQERARKAYVDVAAVPNGERKDYKIAVHSFGTFVLREGLATALAWIERDKNNNAKVRLLDHLRTADVRGIGQTETWQAFCAKVRSVPAAGYMLATRDLLKTMVWYRRAVQALLDREE